MKRTVTGSRYRARAAMFALLLVTIMSCSAAPVPTNPTPDPPAPAPSPSPPTAPPAAVCDNQLPGPASPPAGTVVVDPAVDGDLRDKTSANPAGTTFWIAPGRHTLGSDEFGQVIPKEGSTYVGAPGAVLDGRGVNLYAFTQQAENVTIRHLTVEGFVPPQDQGVVNHDSGNGWIIEHNVIQNNNGAGLMAGARQQVRYNCLRDNGQYGMNAYQAGNGITDLVVEYNEIVGNNTDDWETEVPGCGCAGAVKFWAVDGADVRFNWVHDNRGPGLWGDTNNNDFIIQQNLIENNDSIAVFYETSYNLILQANTVRNNALVTGKQFADRNDNFPVGAVYLSEAGGDPGVPARTNKIDIYDNIFENNWSGITLWENADRFCNSPANTSTGACTRLVSTAKECSPPGLATTPLYNDCRWRTQRVDVHHNTFIHDPAVVGCVPGKAGRMAVLSNFGTYPDWSPYMGTVVQEAITFQQDNRWRDNAYTGPWMFTPFDTGRLLSNADWQTQPYAQDTGSTFSDNAAAAACTPDADDEGDGDAE